MTDTTNTDTTAAPATGFIAEVEADFATVEQAVESVFESAVGAAEAFLKALASSIAANGGQILITAALAGVTSAETTGGTAAEKLAAATTAVETSLATAGVTAAKSAINGAIEAAVATLPTQAAQVATAAAPAV